MKTIRVFRHIVHVHIYIYTCTHIWRPKYVPVCRSDVFDSVKGLTASAEGRGSDRLPLASGPAAAGW